MKAIELNRQKSNRLVAAVEGVGTALAKSAAHRGNTAAMALKMRLIGKAGLSDVEEKAAYKALLGDLSTNDGSDNSGLGANSRAQSNTPDSRNSDEGSGESSAAGAASGGVALKFSDESI